MKTSKNESGKKGNSTESALQNMKRRKDLAKIYRTREKSEEFLPNDTVFERKRNNLKHQERYREITVVDNMATNIIDEDGRKIHKTKLKRKRNI